MGRLVRRLDGVTIKAGENHADCAVRTYSIQAVVADDGEMT
jgi:hypothetical protein